MTIENGKPTNLHSLTPHLVVKDASKAIAFYRDAFGAEELYRLPLPNGGIAHAELRIGDSTLWISDEQPAMGALAQSAPGATSLHLFVAKVDQVFDKAVAAGAKALQPPTDMFWGARYGQVVDPFGHRWSLATQTRDVSPAEMKTAMERMSA